MSDLEHWSAYAGCWSAEPDELVIDHVDAHHGRSLARWRQVDGSGTTVMTGASIARHAADGRPADITGFFLGPPA